MFYVIICYINLVFNIVLFCLYMRHIHFYSKATQYLKTLLNKMEEFEDDTTVLEIHRARLVALVGGGQSMLYLGKEYCIEDIEKMEDGRLERIYARYEARLGSSMTKTLGSTLIQGYTLLASKAVVIKESNRIKLEKDLNDDPFVGHALTSFCCELYHRYGMYLAPITAAVATYKYSEHNLGANDAIIGANDATLGANDAITGEEQN